MELLKGLPGAVVQLAVDAWTDASHPIHTVGVWHLIATAATFFLSFVHRNSSIYDPYWSVGALFTAAAFYWLHAAAGLATRQYLVLALVSLYAWRLTRNWWLRLGHDMFFGDAMARNQHEDWRYKEIKEKIPAGLLQEIAWWGFSSPVLIHLYPTIAIFLGGLPLHYAFSGTAPLNWLDAAGAAVLLGGIALEFFADNDMNAFLETKAASSGQVCRTGLWAYSRHPNYCGEIMIWLGQWMLGVAAVLGSDQATLLSCLATSVGWLQVLGLFLGASIPWLEQRQVSRRPAYKQYQKEVSMLIPLPPASSAAKSK